MSKKYGIGFLVSMIVLTLVLVCAYQYSYDRAERKRKAEQKAQDREPVMQTEGNAKKEYGYVIAQKDGYVIVYYADRETVYEYTSIEVTGLPDDIRERLLEGIEVSELGELYGFLENYSS